MHVSAGIKFHLANEPDIERLAHVSILKWLLYKEGETGRKSIEYGLLDPRLGSTKRGELCETCNLDHQTCIGHWGFFDLPVPVFHIGYLWHIVKILQCICKVHIISVIGFP